MLVIQSGVTCSIGPSSHHLMSVESVKCSVVFFLFCDCVLSVCCCVQSICCWLVIVIINVFVAVFRLVVVVFHPFVVVGFFCCCVFIL